MKFTAEQIAKILKGKILGNPDVEVKSLAKIEEGKRKKLEKEPQMVPFGTAFWPGESPVGPRFGHLVPI